MSDRLNQQSEANIARRMRQFLGGHNDDDKSLYHLISGLVARVEELEAEIERLTTAAPDYVRIRIAKRLAGAEYIHQKLWAHSWEEAGRVMDPEKL